MDEHLVQFRNKPRAHRIVTLPNDARLSAEAKRRRQEGRHMARSRVPCISRLSPGASVGLMFALGIYLLRPLFTVGKARVKLQV